MKKSIRIVSVLLAFVMMFGSMSIAASAAHSDYLDSAIINQYNSIDKVELNLNQKASILLDQLDVMLAKEDMYIEIPLIGNIDLRSTDAALDSIYSITGNWLFGDLTVGDLGVLEDSRSEIASVRRSTADKTDMDVIRSVVAYLAGCAEDGLLNIVDKDFNWGILKGFLPPEFRIIIDDVPKYIKETLWNEMHPVNEVAMPANTTLDSLAQFALDNQIGAVEGSDEAIALGFAGILPGFTVNLATDSAYRVFDEAIFCVLNEVVVPILNGDLKNTITSAVESNQADGGELYTLIDVNYEVAEYTYNRNASLVTQLNDMFKTVVDEMLLPNQFTWNATGTGDPLAVLEDNLERLLLKIIRAGGDTVEFTEGNLAELGDYIARIAVENFVKHIDFDGTEGIEEVAYVGLRELCIRLIPEGTYAEASTINGEEAFKSAILELGADLAVYYLNANIGLNLSYDTTAEDFISEFIEWCEPYINGLFDATELNNVRKASADPNGWDEINAIIWNFFPKDWIPYETMFEKTAGAADGTAADLTFKSLIDYFLNAVIDMDLGALYTFFSYNEDSSLYTMKAYELIIDFIGNILDGAFTVGTTPCVPTGITNFESLFDNSMAHTKTILKNILIAVRDRSVTLSKYDAATAEYVDTTCKLDETVVNLVCMLLGFADPQSLGDVDMDIDSRIYCADGTVPSTTLRISNRSDGVNSAWRNAAGTLAQDQMYKIEVVSVTSNNSGLTCTLPENKVIAANSYIDVAITGTVAATSEVRFDLKYYILDETGTRINPPATADGDTALVKSVYSHFYKETGNYDLTSAESSANNVTFDSFDTYLYTTDVYDMALFSIMATNESGLLTSAATISKAIVTGTLPTGITANAPASGSIVALEDSSASSDTYGTVNPYVANIDNDAAQPYGIYDLDIQFEVKGTGILGNETSATTEARDHIIVIYDDFNLDGVLGDVMDENRQYSDYANADTEWAAYQSAVSAGYALLQGNPDHTKMFTDVNADLAGTQNAYYTAVQNIEAAIAALDAKAVTDTAKLTALQTAVNTYKDVDADDYVLFTYDRFEDAYDRAANLVNSQVAPEGDTTFVAPALKAFDLVYAKEQLELWGGRLLKKAPVKTYLAQALSAANALVETDYTADSWAAFKTARDAATTVNNNTSATLLQTTINDARIELLKKQYDLVEVSAPSYLTPVSSTVIDDAFIYIIVGNTMDITSHVSAAEGFDVYCSTDAVGTGSIVTVEDADMNVVATYTVILYGDIDGNGQIGDAQDISLVNAHINGTTPIATGSIYFTAADVNFDGIINSSDATAIASGNVSQNPNV